MGLGVVRHLLVHGILQHASSETFYKRSGTDTHGSEAFQLAAESYREELFLQLFERAMFAVLVFSFLSLAAS